MKFSNIIRQHWAALRALLVFTVIVGFGYPLLIWLIAMIPGLHDKAEGSILTASGKPVGSKLIGQLFTDSSGNPLPQYFQSRPSAAGSNGYDPTVEQRQQPRTRERRRHTCRPGTTGGRQVHVRRRLQAEPADAGVFAQFGRRPDSKVVDGSRPFCTGGGVGAVLSVIGPRDSRGYVIHPTRVVSVNEPCATTKQPFLDFYEGVRVECAKFGEDYSIGQIVPIRGAAPADPARSGRRGHRQRQRPGPEHLTGLRRPPGRPGRQGPARQPGSDTCGPGAVPQRPRPRIFR